MTEKSYINFRNPIKATMEQLHIKNNWFSFVIVFVIFNPFASCKTQNPISNDSTSTHHKNYEIEGDFSILKVDGFGNIYLLSSANTLQKYDSNHHLMFEYSFNKRGEITSIDVTNPQKILVYFSDFQNIVFLDNTLSEIKTLNLQPLGYWTINGVSLSHDNLIWIYDPVLHQLHKINDNGQKILSSNEHFSSSLDDGTINGLLSNQKNVFVLLPNQILLFDVFGNFEKSIGLKYDNAHLYNNLLLYLFDSIIKSLPLSINIEFNDDSIIYQSSTLFKDFHFNKDGNLLILDSKGLFLEIIAK